MKRNKKFKILRRKRNPSKNYYLTIENYDNSLIIAEGSEEKLAHIRKNYDHYQNLILTDRNLDQLLGFLISQYIQGIGITDFTKEIIGENKLEKLQKYYKEYEITNSQLGKFILDNTPISAEKLHQYLYEK